MFKPDHNKTELLQWGLDKLDHNAKIPGDLLQEAFPDFQAWVAASCASPITALIVLGHNYLFPDFRILPYHEGKGHFSPL